jgi:uncharacterized protein (DUF362 family)
MESRREFLKDAATGALLLGTQGKWALAKALDGHADAGKSRVVIARDAALHNASGQLDEKRVADLLDRAIASYTGRDKPVEAWKRIIAQGNAEGKVIGLKTNGLGGKGISTHAALVYAVAERLQQAGVKPGNIVVWDRNARDLQVCGLAINTDPSRLRCFGSDVSGYEETPETWGTAKIRLSKILTRECAMTLGMKNWYGILGGERNRLHQQIHQSLADLACFMLPTLTMMDCYRILLRNGPTGGNLEDVALKKTVVASTDPVALDAYVAKAYWNIEPAALPYLQMAANRGLGTVEFDKLSVKFSQLG